MKTSHTILGTAAVLLSTISMSWGVAISGLGDPLSNPALAGGTQENFDSAPAGSYNSYTSGNLTLTGVDAPFTIGSDFIGQFNNTGVNSAFNGFDGMPSAWRFDFATPVDAFAFNWGASDDPWTLSAFTSGGSLIESIVLSPINGSNAGEYYGIAASGISYASLTMGGQGGDYVFIDRVTYSGGGGTSVPDGGFTLSLLGIGLACLGFLRRKLS